MPQQTIDKSDVTSHMPKRRGRRRLSRNTTMTGSQTGIAFTTQSTKGGVVDFGTVLAGVLDRYRTRLTGEDLALTINLTKAAWDFAQS